jgi:misacylated tRNA(Ala) deacylase
LTEKIYWLDAYKKELDSKVTSVNSNIVELDRTIFYPAGGGQPSDMGTIVANGKSYNVIDVKKAGNSVLHVLDPVPDFEVGTEVSSKIDWNRRYALMRYHTATHVVGGLATTRYGAMFTGGQLYPDRARFDFDLQSLDRNLALKLVEDSQRIIDQNLDVVAKILSKEEAMNIPNLARTVPGQELLKSMETVRVVEIVGFDLQLDGGTHVSNTKEIGKLELSNYENKGSRRKRIEIILK